MKLQERKSKRLNESIEKLNWFKNEMIEYVEAGDITQEQADLMIEDMADQLGL